MVSSPAVDSHAHVFNKKFGFAKDAHYIPDENQQGSPTEFMDVLHAHGFSHGLLTGALPYGFDNSCMLDAIKNSNGHFKGVALVPPNVTEKELIALNDAGVVGMRINLMFYGNKELLEPGADRMLAMIKEMGWFLQIHCEKDNLVSAEALLRKAGVRMMIDHFCRPDTAAGVNNPGFQKLLEFGREGNTVVKLSGPFRSSNQAYPYLDVDPFVAAVVDAFTIDNCVWGSDWPFVLMDKRVDHGPPLTCLDRWLPDPKDQRKVLWENPARFFGFKA